MEYTHTHTHINSVLKAQNEGGVPPLSLLGCRLNKRFNLCGSLMMRRSRELSSVQVEGMLDCTTAASTKRCVVVCMNRMSINWSENTSQLTSQLTL
jgi:hypothetical protein